jgi:EmrB/QacA subfamily drug resistance transporter
VGAIVGAMNERSSPSPWVALTVLLVGTFMASLDVAIVNVAAPAIEADLGATGAALQLIVAGYSVVYATLLVVGARLGADHGQRRLFLGGLAGFTVASLLCGLAWSSEVLIGARLVQGTAAAAMAPQVISTIQLAFDGPARARALALQSTIVSAGVVVGLVLGGALVSADILGTSWRPVFLVNVPVGAVLLLVGWRRLPSTRSPARRRLDLPGAALLSLTVALVVVPLVFGHEARWAWWTWACLAAAAPVGALMVAHLRSTTDPVLDLRLLVRGPVARGTIALGAQMVAYGGFLFSLTLHLQQGLGYSALQCGLTFVPYALGFAGASLAMPSLPEHETRRLVPLGLVAAGAAYAALGVGGWNLGIELPLLAVAGAGFGAGFTPVITRMVAGLPPRNAPDASGLITTNVQLSYALGVSTIGSAYLSSGAGSFTGVAVACGALALLAAGLSALPGRRLVAQVSS